MRSPQSKCVPPKYTLPKAEEALDTLANGVFTYAAPHIDGAEADWTDIPAASWTAFKDAHAAWGPAYAWAKTSDVFPATPHRHSPPTADCAPKTPSAPPPRPLWDTFPFAPPCKKMLMPIIPFFSFDFSFFGLKHLHHLL
jgi:hypothetical protein